MREIEHRLEEKPEWIVIPVWAVSALWFCGKYLNNYGGWFDRLGANLCMLGASLGLIVLVFALAILCVPRILRMSLLERLLTIWIALHTAADIAYALNTGWV